MKSSLSQILALSALFLAAIGGILLCIVCAQQPVVPYQITVEAVPAEERTEGIREETSVEKININTASLEELVTLPGIGETIGSRIIAYREEHGSFYDTGELLEVKGIGEKLLASIEPYIFT